MDLFNQISNDNLPGTPLPERLRPKSLDDIIGQEKIIGPNSQFRQMLKAGKIPSLLIWGPPGTGKTTFAQVLAKEFQAEFISKNAIDTGAKDLKVIGDESRERRRLYSRQTILFVDEIHRFNKAQQDVLLPFVERGDFTLIGATTENPSYEINKALLSRCRILIFERLTEGHLKLMLERALIFYGYKVSSEILTTKAQEFLIRLADGDGRRLYVLIEQLFAVNLVNPSQAEKLIAIDQSQTEQLTDVDQTQAEKLIAIDQSQTEKLIDNDQSQTEKLIDVDQIEKALGMQPSYYDKKSDSHYDTISAFIKSVRGSDPDAALYYLARMLKGGEDPLFIARRLVILASEDIGNADPRGLTLAIAGVQAVELIGLPEAAINLAQVTTYLATCPKSNRSYLGLQKAKEFIEENGLPPIPLALRSGNSSFLKGIGYGDGYKYSHDSPKGYIDQSFFPEGIGTPIFYDISERGYEKQINEFMKWLKFKPK